MSAASTGIKLLGQHRRGETFEIGCNQFVDFLSHGTVLEDCTLNLRGSAKSVVFHAATLRRCRLDAQRRFTNFSWHDVMLEDCTFTGWFVGCDFGPRPDTYRDHPQGAVSGGDFSQSHLHACRFFRSEAAALQLPNWPCFTVLEPKKNADDWLSIPFPDSYRRVEQKLIAEAEPEYRVEGVSAACMHAGEIAKKHDVSVDEIKALVSGKSYILL